MSPRVPPITPARPRPVAPAAAPGATPWPMPPTLGDVRFQVPESAKRDPRQTALVNDLREEHPIEEVWANADDSLPDPIRDFLYGKVITKVNDVIFRSRRGDGPQPEQPGSWRFGVVGDFGNGTRAMKDVIRNVAAWKPEVVLSTGDQVYPDSAARNWQTKVDPPDMFGGLASRVPVIPNLGNHDMKPSAAEYFKRFPYLEGGRYFQATYRNVDVFSLDTNQSLAPGSPQHSWLAGALAASQAPWKIVSVHHPMMSLLSKVHDRKTSRLPGDLGPLLARHGVDLLVAGHEHFYERSKPLNETGTLQVTVGGGGGALFPLPYPQLQWSQTRDVDFGHVDFEVRGDDELVGRYVSRDGRVQDTFVVPNRTPAGWRPGDALVGGPAMPADGAPPTEPA